MPLTSPGGCELNLKADYYGIHRVTMPSSRRFWGALRYSESFLTIDFAPLLVTASAMSTSAAVMNSPNQYIHFSAGSGWAAKRPGTA